MNESEPSTSSTDVFVFTAGVAPGRRKAGDIRGHDFRQSGFLAPSELRRIRQRHEQFVRSLAARLAIFLRLEFTLQLEKIQIAGYQNFIENLPTPTHITLFKTDPLKGVNLLVIPPRFGLTMVDRLLGGPGENTEEPRDLSEIEVALIDQISSLVIGEWCNHWPEMPGLQVSLLGHENNSRYLQTAAPDAAMLVLTLSGGIGEQSESIQIVFPYGTIEPLVRLLSPALPAAEAGPTRTAKPTWNEHFDEVKVPVVAEWHGLKMSAGEISKLRVGDLLALDPSCAAQVHLRLSEVHKFIGRPGKAGGKWAVQLTNINSLK